MESEKQIACPKCGSNQLTADKKGFSGGKALAGAVLTGGIGLLAGTIGSKDVIITCLACGKQFKPGQGRVKAPERTAIDSETLDGQLSFTIRHEGLLNAVKECKDKTGWDLRQSKEYVDTLVKAQGLKPKAGCAALILLLVTLSISALLFGGYCGG